VLRAAIARLSKHTFTYAAAEQIGRLAGFLLIPLTTGYLSTADFGTRDQVATTLALLAQLAGLNIVAAMARFYFEDDDETRRRRVISTTVLSVVAAAGALACLLALGAGPLGRLLMPDDARGTRIVLIALGIFVFQMLRETQNKVLQTQERSLLFGTLQISKLVCEISLQVFFLVHLHAGLEGLLWAILITEGAFACLLSSILLPRVGLGFSSAIFAALFAYALPLIPNGVLQFMLHSGDRYILQWLGGRDALGMYALAYKLGYMPNYLVLGPFLLIWYPYVFSLGDEAKQREMCGRLAPYLMLLMTAMAFVVALFAREIVHTMAEKPEFYEAWIAVPLVSLGYWFWGLFQLVQTGFYVVKRAHALPLLTLSAVLVNFYLNFLLIPVCGFEGAAIATVVTFAVLAFVTERRVQQVFAVDFPWRRIFTPALAAAGLTVALLFLPATLETWSLALKFGACLAWITWAWFGGFFDRDERHAIVSAVSNFAHRKA
jgi:O-antigen/teichoic acid export membrane protein